MKLKTLSLAVALAASGFTFSGNAAAKASLSGNLALATNYMWRGVTLSSNDPSISGGLDLAFDSGFYVGTWWASANTGGSGVEIDGYFGYTKEYDSGFNFDVGLIHYNFPGISGFNGEEIYAGVGYSAGKVSVGAKGWWGISDYDGADYYEGNISYAITDKVSLNGHVGTYTFSGGGDYVDWMVSVSTSAFGLDWALAYVDNDLAGNAGIDHVLLTVSKGFDIL